MLLSELIKDIDKSMSNRASCDFSSLSGEFYEQQSYCYDWESFTSRVVGYPLSTTLCTDTIVGTVVYFLDGGDEPMFLTRQKYRKSDIEYFFTNQKTYDTMKAVVDTFITDSLPTPSFIEDVEMSKGYKAAFAENILADHLFWNDQIVTVASRPRDMYASDQIDIITEYGEKLTVNVNDVTIPWNINKWEELL